MRTTSPAFNFQVLNFRSFRDFLKDAVDHGVVTVTWPAPHSGLDAYVWLTGEAHEPLPLRPSDRPRRIRADLWRAFVNRDTSVDRHWDRKRSQVVDVPAGTAPNSSSVADTNLVPIASIPIERQIEWMAAFASELDSEAPERPLVEAALATPRPASAFVAAVRPFPATETLWRNRLAAHVVEAIERWKTEHAVAVDLFDVETSKPTQSQRAGRAPRESGELSDDDVRERVIAAVRAMPMSDVLQLRLPVEYLLRR